MTGEQSAGKWKFYEATHRAELEIMDRVGGGDSFASGLIYGFLQGHDGDKAVNYGAAHGALAMTTPGDTSMATLAEVEKIMGGGGAGSFAKPIFYYEQISGRFIWIKEQDRRGHWRDWCALWRDRPGARPGRCEIVIVGRNPDKATERLSAIEQAGGGYFLPAR